MDGYGFAVAGQSPYWNPAHEWEGTVCGRERCRTLHALARLYINRPRDMHWLLRGRRYHDLLAFLQIVGDHAGLRPVQVPTIFDGDDGVFAGDHCTEAEGSIEVA